MKSLTSIAFVRFFLFSFGAVLACGTLNSEEKASGGSGSGQLPPAATLRVDYERDIQPVLEKHCVRCHGSKRQRSAFRLDRRSAVLEGGLNGPAIVVNDSARSPLVHYVAGLNPDLLMPPKGERLTGKEIGLLRAWIDQGLAFTGNDRSEDEKDEVAVTHWAFRPLLRPELPDISHTNTGRKTAIDAFVMARLERSGLEMSAVADRATLIRRLSLDVLGLPPQPEEIDAFVADSRPGAYAKLVDRYLASPRYGERWARHWLDVVRFAETYGFEPNKPRNTAWYYRDYVIESFNEDQPYAKFFRDQIAGDAFGELRATGYLVAGPQDQVESPNLELTLNKRANELHDIVSTTGSAFLGLTVGCARCHNHKFDPVSQKDYYAMTAMLAGVHHGERHLPRSEVDEHGRQRQLRETKTEIAEVLSEISERSPLAQPTPVAGSAGSTRLRPAISSRFVLDRFAPVMSKSLRITVLDSSSYEPCIDEIEVLSADDNPRNVAAAENGGVASASSTVIGFRKHKLTFVNDGWYSNGRSWVSDEHAGGWVQIDFASDTLIDTVVWARGRLRFRSDRVPTKYRIEVKTASGDWLLVASSDDREPWKDEKAARERGEAEDTSGPLSSLHDRRRKLEDRLFELLKGRPAYIGRFLPPPTTHRLHRGDPLQEREVVSPGTLSRVGVSLELPVHTPERDRRAALARWLSAPGNPLPARVLVNRLWMHHFGAGIVNTPSDFGVNGERPTHPKLLDWLASELIENGGSMKHIQRLILLSKAYRQSSQPNEAARAVDAQSRLLWRFPPQRLAAEPIRDSILSASGSLRLTMGGMGYHVFEPNKNYVRVYKPKKSYGPAEWRRMVYQFKPRMEQDAIFGVFDCPDAAQVAPKRTRSTTPLQALNLLNSGFMVEQAERFAARVFQDVAKSGGDDRMSSAIRRAFRLAVGRRPESRELAAATLLAREHGLDAVCRALFNSNEFLHVD
ncbi:MAG: PSD1 and planctomycete cytochrome C domain-containing protein [Planctomycetes bacterium]|nr:PSD1 and planctomycete cytochrome C domain-containing protein [Planctomycetota bacterium]